MNKSLQASTVERGWVEKFTLIRGMRVALACNGIAP